MCEKSGQFETIYGKFCYIILRDLGRDVQCSPFIMLYLGSIEMESVISKLYIGK